jgi:pentatricopeptide repeat domain-containing protein 1
MWEKAEDIFEQMKFQGCRPDVVTYTALIGAYERAGEWQRAAKSFDHMLQLGCKPDSYVYQTIIDMLWQTGVTWAQARAIQLFAIACRNWQYRFLVQSTSPDIETVEFIVPASTASVAVLSTHKWLLDLRSQLEKGATVLFPSKQRFVLSVGRGRHSRDVCNAIKTSLCALLDSLGAPFT